MKTPGNEPDLNSAHLHHALRPLVPSYNCIVLGRSGNETKSCSSSSAVYVCGQLLSDLDRGGEDTLIEIDSVLSVRQ